MRTIKKVKSTGKPYSRQGHELRTGGPDLAGAGHRHRIGIARKCECDILAPQFTLRGVRVQGPSLEVVHVGRST